MLDITIIVYKARILFIFHTLDLRQIQRDFLGLYLLHFVDAEFLNKGPT